ncbi:DUF924 family protein [Azomonas macrocytogenes]|uniref:Uncharacterized protein (DUF924 family) n=1 Tax=Azomonas macrocytogenes TaxID=69962 RepID=A0A839T189_AZOMA|nr:DUF924 family protein [Azomonas macrocytogenes]MBB3102878.1 uncharacterized protein (DUF924 family) [Azomonas macrocytogenes]
MLEPWQPLFDWWFGRGTSAGSIFAEKKLLWFGQRAEQDAETHRLFSNWVDDALHGELDDWADVPQGWLALIILLDQLPRMIHRDTPQAFAGDERALQLVRDGLSHGVDMLLSPIQRVFAYLVLEHAENLAMQEQSVGYFGVLRDIAKSEERELFDGFLAVALRHRDVIAHFGRFPYRNAALGRASSEAEVKFLSQPGTRF